jgi:hypothetical protein
MLTICVAIYLIVMLLLFAFVWAALVVAKRNDEHREYELLKGHTVPAKSASD